MVTHLRNSSRCRSPVQVTLPLAIFQPLLLCPVGVTAETRVRQERHPGCKMSASAASGDLRVSGSARSLPHLTPVLALREASAPVPCLGSRTEGRGAAMRDTAPQHGALPHFPSSQRLLNLAWPWESPFFCLKSGSCLNCCANVTHCFCKKTHLTQFPRIMATRGETGVRIGEPQLCSRPALAS